MLRFVCVSNYCFVPTVCLPFLSLQLTRALELRAQKLHFVRLLSAFTDLGVALARAQMLESELLDLKTIKTGTSKPHPPCKNIQPEGCFLCHHTKNSFYTVMFLLVLCVRLLVCVVEIWIIGFQALKSGISKPHHSSPTMRVISTFFVTSSLVYF